MTYNSRSNFWDSYYENGIIPNIWKGITGQTSADRNADQNLQYQKERNAIEDARYEEETAYNRAFAEEQRDYERARYEEERDYNRAWNTEERDYNRAFSEEQRDYERALQQQVFEREDTAIERQASQLSKLGINPIGQNLSGLGSGSVVSAGSAPVSVGAGVGSASGSPSVPSASSRGGQALNRAMQKFGSLSEFLGSFESILRPLQDINEGIQAYNTGNLTRDALALENDKKFLENFKFAHDLGIRYDKPATDITKGKNFRSMRMNLRNSDGESIFDMPEYKGTMYNGYFNNDTLKGLNTFSRGGFDGILERSLTKGAQMVDKASNKLFDLDSKESKKFNLFDFLKDIIF